MLGRGGSVGVRARVRACWRVRARARLCVRVCFMIGLAEVVEGEGRENCRSLYIYIYIHIFIYIFRPR